MSRGPGKRQGTGSALKSAALAAAAILLLGGGLALSRLCSRSPRSQAPPAEALATVPVRSGPSWKEMDDPARDGWESEVVSGHAAKQLDRLKGWLLHPEAAKREDLAAFLAEGFTSTPIRPPPYRVVFEDAHFRVERGEEPLPDPSAEFREAAGFIAALTAGAPPAREVVEERAAFKVLGIERGAGDEWTTEERLELLVRTGDGAVEEVANWRTVWKAAAGGAELRLKRLSVSGFERVTRPSGDPLFADCTGSVLGKNRSFGEQLLRGLDEWAGRIQDRRFFSLLGTPGLAVGDVNADGLDDLYLCQEGGLPNRLFVQDPDGSAADGSERSGADWLESARSALLLDLDGDGDQDLACAVFGALVLAAGDGQGRFERGPVLSTPTDTMSLCAADYDHDGDLDLYVTAYKRDDLLEESGVLSLDTSEEFVYHDANDGAPNTLFRNQTPRGGPLSFSDVTREAGLDHNNHRYSFAAAWEDYDQDGDQDLYVANDFGRNNLYRNDLVPGGVPRFTDVAPAAGAEDSASSMSVSWSDLDRDGWMDLYIGNMFSAAGSRITAQAAFKPEAPEEVRARLRRFARGNTLLRNRGDGSFEDASVESGALLGRWAWSSNAVDLNLDGWEDLVVANGYITTEDPGDL